MPVIAQIMIPIRFHGETVEILKEKFNECGCLDLVTESKRLQTPIETLRQSIYGIDGIVCQGDTCCVSDISSFAEKLKRFQEDS